MEFIIQEAAAHMVMHIDDIYNVCDIFQEVFYSHHPSSAMAEETSLYEE